MTLDESVPNELALDRARARLHSALRDQPAEEVARREADFVRARDERWARMRAESDERERIESPEGEAARWRSIFRADPNRGLCGDFERWGG